ncbi:phosphoribosylformylglycinamidine synthase [Herbivorax sp. ANBcel31]|uniref:phosphoribosylformylglycinamidine synthase n=1 Tax=Herbivorax sp. ANBcel31 TaxID=3069754 RepID=UPI0027B0ACC2|nr:phosphoribosylformylglycinamidine synthase [Herbivorax sp. ANBcel31]MDQ2087462.1 phosphoribosylformylglycinamidine synthase [Herbivorax sp. ANBcel31]
MIKNVRRVFVEKKKGFDVEGQSLFADLKDNLGISNLKSVRVINRYDVEGLSEDEFEASKKTIFSEPPVDRISDETIDIDDSDRLICIEYLPGQYDQRADSASQCIQILTHGEKPKVKVAKIVVLSGEICDKEYEKAKEYLINPVESQEASMEKPDTLEVEVNVPEDVKVLDGFINMDSSELKEFRSEMGFAMSLEDLEFCRNYFKDTEKRDPTMTEIRVIDTYWSDHCRHTTFLTNIKSVEIEDGYYTEPIKEAYNSYLESRDFVYGDREKDICLMDIATISMKELKKRGKLDDLDESDEINACSIQVKVDVDGREEEWLVMFKNETHNHPTEIEPFGGAATCLGGAIRDPLSGRSYVYQAMRVTGSGDPRTSVEDTISGKLPQRKITTGAAHGYSSYGNQIGLSTGQVEEIYDEGYVAKRMEIGAVIGATPRKNVVREKPNPGDIIVLLGGRTGRDGCGGATGSSKEHTEESLLTCGAEVQKGNPPTERKIQRLFRKPLVSTMIKRCNDFGAGGVSVAIGELADGLNINLDVVPKKYEGLDGTEISISESQERMAVVISKEDVETFINAARIENLEATPVAKVTKEPRLVMTWRNSDIVNISRDFLDTNGAKQNANIKVNSPLKEENYFKKPSNKIENLEEAWFENLQNLNVCSKKGLVEMFDSTIGANTVFMPFGGKYQMSPLEGMIAKIPVERGDTKTGSIMTYGYNPLISRWSPFHGAVYAVLESVAKVVAMGGDYKSTRLTFQEYFEKLGTDPEKWGKPFSALLGAYYAQMKFGIAAIGGKDSMSGTFKDMDVPPTLVSFAVNVTDVNNTVSTEFKKTKSKAVLLTVDIDEKGLPDFEGLYKKYEKVNEVIKKGKVLSSHSVRKGGISEAVSKMCFGNMIGFKFKDDIDENKLFEPLHGSIILEFDENESVEQLLNGVEFEVLGTTQEKKSIDIKGNNILLDRLCNSWEEPLEMIFPVKTFLEEKKPKQYEYSTKNNIKPKVSVAKPRIFMPVFPGTNCEYDTAKAFERAGGEVEVFVMKNLSSKEVDESIGEMAKAIQKSQIIMLPGGFSGGDEPDGSGKFIATAFRNPKIKDAVMNLIKNRDGLMLGICNGFQALIKLGLVPYGEIRDLSEDSPTLTFNTIGRHVSCMVRTRVTSNLSPWFNNVNVGDVHSIPVSHGEGRFVANNEVFDMMEKNGQIATQYVDFDDNATNDIRFNPNGSFEAVEGITSPDGRILGKMGHSERIGTNVIKNVPGEKDQKIFEAGVKYFK